MQLKVQTVIDILEKLAPKSLALEWDNVGLQLGSPTGNVNKIYVALEITEAALNEAIEAGANFIATHHPFLFKPLKAVRTDEMRGRIIQQALNAGLHIYAAHTNLDLADGGVNDALAARIGLQETEILQPAGEEKLEKIVVFVPRGYEDKVLSAMAAAGAGWIGKYSHCSFQAPGTGTFLPQEGAKPFLGEIGQLEKAEEVRLETIMPAELRKGVVQAMLESHPYEEVAYDIYPLLNNGRPYGLGRLGRLPAPVTLAEFCRRIKKSLDVPFVRAAGDAGKTVKKVAVCGGAGSDLIKSAIFAGADVLVTGDLKYHEAQEASNGGLAVVDAGHDATERIIVPVLCEYLRKQLQLSGYQTEVVASTIETNIWRVY